LVPTDTCAALTQAGTLPLKVSPDGDVFLRERQQLLEQQLKTVNRLAIADALPDTIITEAGLKITPLTNAVPEDVDALIQTGLRIIAARQVRAVEYGLSGAGHSGDEGSRTDGRSRPDATSLALGWEHINLTGDYIWRQSRKTPPAKFRPLRPFPHA
jgi:hypothetical protein